MLIPGGIEISPLAHVPSLYSRDYWTRRVPEKCEDLVEKSSKKAFASRLPAFCQLHHLRSRGQLVPEVGFAFCLPLALVLESRA
jgi:hypothetical protein